MNRNALTQKVFDWKNFGKNMDSQYITTDAWIGVIVVLGVLGVIDWNCANASKKKQTVYVDNF
jgi:hypothetical protein